MIVSSPSYAIEESEDKILQYLSWWLVKNHGHAIQVATASESGSVRSRRSLSGSPCRLQLEVLFDDKASTSVLTIIFDLI